MPNAEGQEVPVWAISWEKGFQVKKRNNSQHNHNPYIAPRIPI